MTRAEKAKQRQLSKLRLRMIKDMRDYTVLAGLTVGAMNANKMCLHFAMRPVIGLLVQEQADAAVLS